MGGTGVLRYFTFLGREKNAFGCGAKKLFFRVRSCHPYMLPRVSLTGSSGSRKEEKGRKN